MFGGQPIDGNFNDHNGDELFILYIRLLE